MKIWARLKIKPSNSVTGCASDTFLSKQNLICECFCHEKAYNIGTILGLLKFLELTAYAIQGMETSYAVLWLIL